MKTLIKSSICLIALLICCNITVFAQCSSLCTIDLQDDGTFFSPTPFTDVTMGSADVDIVVGSSPTLSGETFDILDASSTACAKASDGANDFTMDFEIESFFDVYGGGVLTASTGNDAARFIEHRSTGLRGSNANGNVNANATSTGDVSCYNLTVQFTTAQEAQDVDVDVTSINTRGKAFESASIIFLDESYAPYGTATYNGFWETDPQGSNGGTNSTMVNTEAMIYTTTGTGVYIAADPGTVDITDPLNPVAASNGPNDNTDINASSNTGLDAEDKVGGFIFRVCLEDVATTIPDVNDKTRTTTSTSFTSTLNSFSVCPDFICSATIMSFPSAPPLKDEEMYVKKY